jgi:hypothetical protein
MMAKRSEMHAHLASALCALAILLAQSNIASAQEREPSLIYGFGHLMGSNYWYGKSPLTFEFTQLNAAQEANRVELGDWSLGRLTFAPASLDKTEKHAFGGVLRFDLSGGYNFHSGVILDDTGWRTGLIGIGKTYQFGKFELDVSIAASVSEAPSSWLRKDTMGWNDHDWDATISARGGLKLAVTPSLTPWGRPKLAPTDTPTTPVAPNTPIVPTTPALPTPPK